MLIDLQRRLPTNKLSINTLQKSVDNVKKKKKQAQYITLLKERVNWTINVFLIYSKNLPPFCTYLFQFDFSVPTEV